MRNRLVAWVTTGWVVDDPATDLRLPVVRGNSAGVARGGSPGSGKEARVGHRPPARATPT